MECKYVGPFWKSFRWREFVNIRVQHGSVLVNSTASLMWNRFQCMFAYIQNIIPRLIKIHGVPHRVWFHSLTVSCPSDLANAKDGFSNVWRNRLNSEMVAHWCRGVVCHTCWSFYSITWQSKRGCEWESIPCSSTQFHSRVYPSLSWKNEQ